MSAISNLSQIKKYDPAAAAAIAAGNDPTSTKDMTQNFLKMLTAQLQNQDPLNPTDSAGMTTQLAQLNMVDGINKMNTSMMSLLSQIQSTDFINMATTVGKTAMAEGNKVLFTGDSVNLGAKLVNDASSVTATIKNSAGATVAETDLGPGSEGLFNFIWDGLDGEGNVLPSGFYSISIVAETADGALGYPKVYSSSKVATIGKDGSDLEVTLADGRTIKPSDIEQWVA
jgi:flagellar basal-body rod modification protein FlgD